MPTSKPGPKYVHIKNAILQRIRDGQLAPGQQIHSISEIMEEFTVSKVTAVRALSELEAEGIVRREHGRGTFVAPFEGQGANARIRKGIAVIVPNMSNPFHVEVVGALERRLRDRDVVVELNCTDYDVESEQALFDRISVDSHVSGMVLISTPVPHNLLNGSPTPRFPMIVIDYCPPDLLDKCIFFSCDNYKGGYDAATHLAALGHERIGYINLSNGSLERLEGFKRGLEDHGRALLDRRMLTAEFGKPLGDELVDLVRREGLTAIFAHNDMLAMQAMHLLRAADYSLPDDVSLVGYDDVAAARYLEVPLTTIDQHEEQIGRKAAEVLLAALESNGRPMRPREIVVVPQLVVRASTAPPRVTVSS